MHLEVTFRNLRARDEIRTRAELLFAKLHRFLDPAAGAQLVVAVEHENAVIELVVTSRGEVHKVEEEDAELRTALDKVFHTMEVNLRRAKERRIDTRRRAGEVEDGFVSDDDDDAAGDSPAI